MKKCLSLVLSLCLFLTAVPIARMEGISSDGEVISAPVEKSFEAGDFDLIGMDSEGEAAPTAEETSDVPRTPTAKDEPSGVLISEAAFPDATFRQYVQNTFDRDGDGALSGGEISNAITITITQSNVQSLAGIEHFTELMVLHCFYNNLKGTLDLSACTRLHELNCCCNQLTALKLSGCSELSTLNCADNQLTALDISGCPALRVLECYMNSIPSVYIGKCPNLVKTYNAGNPITITLDKGRASLYYQGVDGSGQIEVDKNTKILSDGAPAPGPATDPSTPTIELSEAFEKVVRIGDGYQIVVPAGWVKSYKSSSKKVATVSETGYVQALKEGKAKITVTLIDKRKLVLTLVVTDPNKPANASIQGGKTTVAVGGTLQLNAVLTTLDGAETTDSKLKWKAKPTSVATVDKNGLVKGKKAGDATITVTTSNKIEGSIAIKVLDAGFERAFLESSYEENPAIRLESISTLCESGVSNKEKHLAGLGFVDTDRHKDPMKDFFDGWESDQHDSSFVYGYKDFDSDDGQPIRLFALVIEGTGTGEWGSDFTIGLGKDHEGFRTAADNAWAVFEKYYNAHLDGSRQTKIWITGHSRGAAIANLLAGEYFDRIGVGSNQVYAYTYACPNVVKGTPRDMRNIFNYNIGGDCVGRVPFVSWGFHRYGRTYILKNKSKINSIAVLDYDTMNSIEAYLSELTDADYISLIELFKNIAGAEAKPSLGVILYILVKTIQDDMEAKILSKILILDKRIENAIMKIKMANLATHVVNTHDDNTYLSWIKSLKNKKLL